MKINSDDLHLVFVDCLFKDGEDTEGYVEVEGVQLHVGFHPERLEGHRKEIEDMLGDLPEEFKAGWTFLNMNQDKSGAQWADLHLSMDELVVLGLALELITFTFPRAMWDVLPGGVPYIKVSETGVEHANN